MLLLALELAVHHLHPFQLIGFDEQLVPGHFVRIPSGQRRKIVNACDGVFRSDVGARQLREAQPLISVIAFGMRGVRAVIEGVIEIKTVYQENDSTHWGENFGL